MNRIGGQDWRISNKVMYREAAYWISPGPG